eukprot:2802121-Rhodomonas_salina.2
MPQDTAQAEQHCQCAVSSLGGVCRRLTEARAVTKAHAGAQVWVQRQTAREVGAKKGGSAEHCATSVRAGSKAKAITGTTTARDPTTHNSFCQKSGGARRRAREREQQRAGEGVSSQG